MQPLRAELRDAYVALKLKDYPMAFREFKASAELGSPLAQYDLAILYANGHGTDISLTNAYAWATLAADNGHAAARALADTLKPQLTEGSLRLAKDIVAPYRPAVLEARLLPVMEQTGVSNRVSPKRIKTVMPIYPPDAEQRGIQGAIFAEFVVALDGRTRNPRFVYAIPGGVFEYAVRESLANSVYEPGRIDGKPVAMIVRQMFRFSISSLKASDYSNLGNFLKRTQKQADDGDAGSQTLMGLMIAGLPQLGRQSSEALPWFVKAAQGGEPTAQYQVGLHLEQGWGCRCEQDKAFFWLQRAAASGQHNAQVMIAANLLAHSPDEASIIKAKEWLERAVAGNDREAKFYLAALLAASPSAEIRDPKRALDLMKEAGSEYRFDPTAEEIRAAARAQQGDFKAALKEQGRAIEKARELGWEDSALQERNASYQRSEAWTGNLFADVSAM